MSQHDYDLANQSRTAFRADLNNALLAIVTQNSGATAPVTTYAYQWWADTTTGLLKVRNAANSAWVTVGTLADAYFGNVSRTANNLLTGAGNTFQGRLNTASAIGGTADAITATHDPAFTAWVDKMRGTFRATGANTLTTPSFAPDGLPAKTFAKNNVAALAAGDIAGAGHEVEWIYNLTADKVLILNPKGISSVSTGQLNTAIGVASVSAVGTGILNVTMNDYSFSPSITMGTTVDATDVRMLPTKMVDPNNTVGQFSVSWTGGTAGSVTARWRYVTASDQPTVWVIHDATGNILGAWVSDDPPPTAGCPIGLGKGTAVRIDPNSLAALGVSPDHYSWADAWIAAKKYSSAHRDYRAFQRMTGQDAPASWLLEHTKFDLALVRLVLK